MKEISIETFILFVHFSFIGIAFYELNDYYRFYLDAIAFFSMLVCIFIDIVYMIISSLVNSILLIHKFRTSVNKSLVTSKKLLKYKKDCKTAQVQSRPRITTRGNLRFKKIIELKSCNKNINNNNNLNKMISDLKNKKIIIQVKPKSTLSGSNENPISQKIIYPIIQKQEIEFDAQKEESNNFSNFTSQFSSNNESLQLPIKSQNPNQYDMSANLPEKERVQINHNISNKIQENFQKTEIQQNTRYDQEIVHNKRITRDFLLIKGFVN